MEDNSQPKVNRPLLSICIPTYNRAAYFLPECLNSLVSQFTDEEICRQVEIVISDNASTDNTEAVVKGYQEKFNNIKYFKHSLAVTPALNWDNAVKNSRGHYINTIGDDDMYLPDSLDRILSLLLTEESKMIAVAYVEVINGEVCLPDNYSGEMVKVAVTDIVKHFFNFSAETGVSNFSLVPPLLFFSGEVARGMINTTGYFWKEPICDHWAILSCLYQQSFMMFYDYPIIGYRIHANNHLGTKYKNNSMKKRLEDFLNTTSINFNLFPGPSFTNLGYAGMQDIQFHFPWYRQFPINTDRGLVLHIDDILHSDFSVKEKIKYSWQSWRLIRRRKFWCGAKLFFKGIRFVGKFIAAYFKNQPV